MSRDNFETGYQYDIDQAVAVSDKFTGEDHIALSRFVEGDRRVLEDC